MIGWQRFVRLLLAVCGLVGAVSAIAGMEAKKAFDLPKDQAVQTLKMAALQGDIEILFSDEIVRGVATRKVEGSYTSEEILDLLLRDTPLEAVQDSESGAFAILRRDSDWKMLSEDASAASTPVTNSNLDNRKMDTKKNFIATLRAALIAVVASGATSAHAQDDNEEHAVFELSPFTVASSEEEDGYYASDSLSATRFRSKISEIPTPIQVLTSDFLEDIDAVDISETLQLANNVKRQDDGASQSFAGLSVSIRGFGAPLKRNGFSNWGFGHAAIVERVEIPKGPQSTLFGQQAPGGVVNFVTKRPTFSDFRGTANFSMGNNDYLDFKLDVEDSMTENFAWRLVTAFHNEGGWQPYQDKEDFVIYPSISWNISDKVRFHASFEYLERAQSKVTRPMEGRDSGLQNLDHPFGLTSEEVASGLRGRYPLVYDLGSPDQLGSDPRSLSLSGPINRGNDHGQFVESRNLYADLEVDLFDGITYRVSGQHANHQRHGKYRMADILNFRTDAKTGDISWRWKQTMQDTDVKEIRNELLINRDFDDLPLVGVTNYKLLFGVETVRTDGYNGSLETLRNLGEVMPLEALYPDAFEDVLRLRSKSDGTPITRQDLVDANSELLGTFTTDPRTNPPPSNAAFLDGNGMFARGDVDGSETSLDAYYANLLLNTLDYRLRIMGGIRKDDNEFEPIELVNNYSLAEESRDRFVTNETSSNYGASYTLIREKGALSSLNVFAGQSSSFVPNNARNEYRVVEERGYFLDGLGGGFVDDPTDPSFPFRLVEPLEQTENLGAQTGDGTDFGVKFSAFNNRLNGTATYFEVSRSGIVRGALGLLKRLDARFYDPATFDPENPILLPSASIATLSGEEEASGFEYEFNFQATENWDIYLGFVFMDSEIVSNDSFPETIGLPVPDAPDESVNFLTKYTFNEGALKDLTVGFGTEYFSQSFISDSPTSFFYRSGPETLYRLFASYKMKVFDNIDTKIRFNVDNLTDEIYLNSRFGWGRGRTYRFGIETAF